MMPTIDLSSSSIKMINTSQCKQYWLMETLTVKARQFFKKINVKMIYTFQIFKASIYYKQQNAKR